MPQGAVQPHRWWVVLRLATPFRLGSRLAVPAIDRETMEAGLDALFGELEGLDRRAKAALAAAKG
ncbi:MAG: hypothetical protein ACR2RA_21145 [Geminicoccaceae bacterium]